MKKIIIALVALATIQYAQGQLIETSKNAFSVNGRLYLQHKMDNALGWARGNLSTGIYFNHSTNVWQVGQGNETYVDFSMINFGNGGAMEFYTRPDAANSPYTLSHNGLQSYRRMRLYSIIYMI